MPYVSRMRPLLEYYNPLTRRQQCPLFNYRYLRHTAHNLAAAVRALHARGYVSGLMDMSRNTSLEALLNVQWQAILPMVQDILLEGIRRVRLHAIPSTVAGTILGIIWGASGR